MAAFSRGQRQPMHPSSKGQTEDPEFIQYIKYPTGRSEDETGEL